MLSQFDNDTHHRIRRSKSAASVKERRKNPIVSEPLNPETGRAHAIIAAHRAIDRSRASASTSDDLHRSESSVSKSSARLVHKRHAGSDTGSSDLRRQRSVLQGSDTQLAASLPMPKKSNQARGLGYHYTQPALSEFGANYEGEPSSYRRLRKAKSVLNPSRG